MVYRKLSPPKRNEPVPTGEPRQDGEPLAELLARLGIGEWDYLIVGDGSHGSSDSETASSAWTAVLIERVSGRRRVWAGAVSAGTGNAAEMLAYVLPLLWVTQRHRRNGRRPVRVHVLTDSSFCIRNGCSRTTDEPGLASLLSCIVSDAARCGVVVVWHQIKRNSVALHAWCDAVSRFARRQVEAFDWSRAGHLTVDDVNPSTDG